MAQAPAPAPALLALTLLLAIGPSTAAQAPAYPHALPEWYVRQRTALRTSVSLDFSGVDLSDVLASIGRMIGAPIGVDAPGMTRDQLRVHLKVDRLEAASALKLLCDLKRLDVRHSATGIVATNRPARYPTPAAAPIRRGLKAALAEAQAVPVFDLKHARAHAELRRRLATTRLTIKLRGDAPGDAVLAIVQATGLPLVISMQAGNHLALRGTRLTYACRDLPAGTALGQLLGAAGLAIEPVRGQALLIGTVAEHRERRAERAARRRALAERRAATLRLLARPVPDELSGQHLHQIGAALTRAIGVPVYIGPHAWGQGDTLTGPTAGRSLAQLSARLPARVRMVVHPDAIYLVELPAQVAPEGRPR